MEPSLLLITALMGTATVLISEPYFSSRLRKGGFVAQDMYKPGEVMLPNKGGLLILFGGLCAIIGMTVAFRLVNFVVGENVFPRSLSAMDEAILYTVLIFAFYGVLDDYVNVGRTSKIFLPLLFSYPLVSVLVMPRYLPVPLLGSLDLTRTLIPFDGAGITVSQVIRYLIVPVYIMVVANLVNMHSGFNGLQSGLSLILLTTLFIKTTIHGDTGGLFVAAALTGGLLGFWWFNRYPARFFEGNIGSMAIGATIGAVIISHNLYFTGVIILIPHIINFLMYVYWRIRRKLLVRAGREVGPYHHQIKFGKLRDDGTLDVPNRLTLKWFIPFHRPTTERQAVLYMYALTGVFCLIGLAVPYY
ncbi:MAG: hypothetical protein J7L61_00610 [Thermoplasmata archaeon]|nr:hypothetical protein [Thermoplasmata archaeon]